MRFSVVVATWNEGAQISSALKRLRQISSGNPIEIIVVDGGSTDGTAELAREWADQVIAMDKPNRGLQLDTGARKAGGDLLFFLPPDAQPPGNWQQALEHFWLASHPAKVAATVFTIDYGAGLKMRLIARAANAMVSWRGVALSDHGLCTSPEIYRDSGGFPHIAYGEEVVFCRRVGRFGEIAMLKETIWPAARRLRSQGALRCALQRGWLGLRAKLGADPDKLWRAYSGL